ncbi:hypothetical protein [Clostridium estertheticum]|uniref:hypothetical protein n=1 Tax=Clostridium estertheticum TaxID=238834 RepID=UPI001C0E506D|nr:hypothetical protein [Clostridium estertheticum]MBU3169894.1 hypothetical protein [Clostridium estertheticum]
MIVDGAVNDYTKRKGFFAEATDVNSWDCLVGCNDGLKKLKDIYYKSRKKTNIEMIDLHGQLPIILITGTIPWLEIKRIKHHS